MHAGDIALHLSSWVLSFRRKGKKRREGVENANRRVGRKRMKLGGKCEGKKVNLLEGIGERKKGGQSSLAHSCGKDWSMRGGRRKRRRRGGYRSRIEMEMRIERVEECRAVRGMVLGRRWSWEKVSVKRVWDWIGVLISGLTGKGMF